ncbi:MAG: hypothetical protein ACSHXF_03875 [Aquaticitalea sp.]
MQKKLISIFFLLLFTFLVSAPTVLTMVENSCDASIFYSVNEEENKVNETLKIFEIKLLDTDQFDSASLDLEKEKSYSAYIKNYTPSTIECFSPPPELS